MKKKFLLLMFVFMVFLSIGKVDAAEKHIPFVKNVTYTSQDDSVKIDIQEKYSLDAVNEVFATTIYTPDSYSTDMATDQFLLKVTSDDITSDKEIELTFEFDEQYEGRPVDVIQIVEDDGSNYSFSSGVRVKSLYYNYIKDGKVTVKATLKELSSITLYTRAINLDGTYIRDEYNSRYPNNPQYIFSGKFNFTAKSTDNNLRGYFDPEIPDLMDDIKEAYPDATDYKNFIWGYYKIENRNSSGELYGNIEDLTVTIDVGNEYNGKDINAIYYENASTDRKVTKKLKAENGKVTLNIKMYENTGIILFAKLATEEETEESKPTTTEKTIVKNVTYTTSDPELVIEGEELETSQYLNEMYSKVYTEKNKGNLLGLYDFEVVSGEIKNNVTLTFNVGTKNNGKTARIVHRKDNGTYETFKKTVKKGKVSISVNSLSPFVVYIDNTTNPPTSSMNVFGYSMVSLISLLTIIYLTNRKRREE